MESCSGIAHPVFGDSSIQCLKSLSNGDELSSGSQAFPSLNGNVQDWAIMSPGIPRGFDARVSDQSEATRFRYGTAIRFREAWRQRLGIAQAIAGDPWLIIVDGPTAGLDPEERLRCYRLLSERAADRIVRLSTHIVEDVAVLCARFAVIRRGRLIAYTTPTDARKTIDGTTFHGHTWSVAFLVFKPLADSVNGVAVSLSGNMVAAAFANQRAELRAADSGAILTFSIITPEGASDVFDGIDSARPV
jgi:hypothetical protein